MSTRVIEKSDDEQRLGGFTRDGFQKAYHVPRHAYYKMLAMGTAPAEIQISPQRYIIPFSAAEEWERQSARRSVPRAAVSPAPVDPAAPVKRGRGRPKGSKNRRPPEDVREAAAEAQA